MTTMDFFQHQDAARRRTAGLVFLFVLAVVAIVLAVYVVVAALMDRLGDLRLLAAVGGATVTVIAVGSLYRIAQLRTGGETIALELGGRRLESPHYGSGRTPPVERGGRDGAGLGHTRAAGVCPR